MTERKPCRKCKTVFTPLPSQIRNRDYLCMECKRQHDAEYRAKRKAEGRPIPAAVYAGYTEKRRAYNKLRRSSEAVKAQMEAYRQLDTTKERTSKRQRERVQDPAYADTFAARYAVRNALRRGDLAKEPCCVCGAIKVQAHHHDHTKPLEVAWLCRPHHFEVHAAIPRVQGQGGEANAEYFTKIPIAEAIQPKPHSKRVEVVANAWWAVTADNCILVYRGLAKQCNQDKRITDLIIQLKNHPAVRSVQIPCVYIAKATLARAPK